MTMTSGVGGRGLAARVQNILLRPTAEWTVIDGERPTTGALFGGYAAPLAAIGPACGVIGALLFSSAALARLGVHLSPVSLVLSAAISWLMSLLAVWIFGLIIDGLAPTFGGVRDRTRAEQTAVYSSTAAWVAGVFQLVPFLGIFVIAGMIYSVVLLYKGLPVTIRAPLERRVGYTVSVALVMVLVWIALGAVVFFISSALGLTPGLSALAHRTVTTSTTTTSFSTTNP